MKNFQKLKKQKRIRRIIRLRAKVKGIAKRPRLCVYKSLKHLYAQIIDDDKSITLVAAGDHEIAKKDKRGKKKSEIAETVGKLIAKKAQKLKIKQVVFDRRRYQYHGIIKSLADGARAGGLEF